MKIALVVGSMAVSVSVQAAVISLSTPVSDSLTPDGIYWTYNDESGGLVADESGNGYNGTMTTGLNGGSPVNPPTLATGVNLPGTSGYDDALSVIGKSPTYSSNMNPSVRYEQFGAPVPVYSMPGGASFTGGTWLNADPATVVPGGSINMYLMSSGIAFSSTSHWSLSLYHDNSDIWRVVFSAGNGSTSSLGSVAITNILDGTWHHVGFNFNGGTNQATIWVDGTQVPGTISLTNGIGTPLDYEQKTFRVGERVSPSFEEMSFTGEFDDTFVTSGLHSFAAVPEPTTVALMAGAGLGALVLRRRRMS